MFREVSSFRFKSTSQGMAARGAEFKGGSHYTSGLEGSEFAVFSGDRANWLGKIEMITMEVHPKYGDCSALAKWLAERNFSVTTDKEGYIYAAIRGRA
jgi:hypothetical protein